VEVDGARLQDYLCLIGGRGLAGPSPECSDEVARSRISKRNSNVCDPFWRFDEKGGRFLETKALEQSPIGETLAVKTALRGPSSTSLESSTTSKRSTEGG
jgi:hypothetical protein